MKVSRAGLEDIKYLMSQINLTPYEIEERIIKMFLVDSIEELSIEQADDVLCYLEELIKDNLKK